MAGFSSPAEAKSATQSERLSQRISLPVYSEAESLLSDFGNKVDVVTMHFVVEHLTDLHESFLQVERLLKPGGAFFFTVPNLESWEAKLFGKKWHGLDAPRHISFPHKSVVDQLARRHGLTLAQARTVPFPNGLRVVFLPPSWAVSVSLCTCVLCLWASRRVGCSPRDSLLTH